MTTLRVGDTAPDFTSVTQDGQPFTKADLMGQRTILYFYPKDNTPSCTRQVCAFAVAYVEFEKLNANAL